MLFSRSKVTRLLGWCAPLLASVGFLAALEAVLRVAGVGYPASYLRPVTLQGAPWLIEDHRFFRAFFPPGLSPYVDPVAFSEQKAPGTFRVFVLGESAALGTPDPAFSFSRILDRMLHARYPGIDFEIINVSATAVNSNVLLPIAKACAAHQPDLFIVYAGNNEFVGPYGPGTVFAPFVSSRAFIRCALALKRTRLGQLLDDELQRMRVGAPARWDGMAMFLKQAIPDGDARLEPAYAHFRANLGDILSTADAAGAHVLLATVGTNIRDIAPFSGKDADMHFQSGKALLRRGNTADTSRPFADASQARAESAAAELTSARDRDALRFRADSHINDIIRETAREPTSLFALSHGGVFLADVDSSLRAATPDHAPGREWFYEHVHFRFEGNYFVARTLLPFVDSVLALRKGLATPADAPLTLEQCRVSLALTGWHRLVMAKKIASLIDGPPFLGESNYEEQRERMRAEIDSLSRATENEALNHDLDEFQTALSVHPDDVAIRRGLGDFFYACEYPNQAEEQFRFVLDRNPQDTRARQMLAKILGDRGETDAALNEYRAALAFDPDSPELHNDFGNALLKLGRASEAAHEYAAALREGAGRAEIHFNLSRAYAALGETAKSGAQLRETLALNPNFSPALAVKTKTQDETAASQASFREY